MAVHKMGFTDRVHFLLLTATKNVDIFNVPSFKEILCDCINAKCNKSFLLLNFNTFEKFLKMPIS